MNTPVSIPKAVRSLSHTQTQPTDTATEAVTEQPAENPAFGTFDDEGNYTPREIVSDDLGMSFADAIDGGVAASETFRTTRFHLSASLRAACMMVWT